MRRRSTSSLLLLLSAMATFASPAARGAGQEGHGGDIAVSIFIGVAHRTAECLKESPLAEREYPSLLGDLVGAIARTSVYSVDKTVLNGNEVDAINYPSVDRPRILINRTRWLDDRLTNSMRALLVFHEYLSIAGYDDSSYKISYICIQEVKNCLNQNQEGK